ELPIWRTMVQGPTARAHGRSLPSGVAGMAGRVVPGAVGRHPPGDVRIRPARLAVDLWLASCLAVVGASGGMDTVALFVQPCRDPLGTASAAGWGAAVLHRLCARRPPAES